MGQRLPAQGPDRINGLALLLELDLCKERNCDTMIISSAKKHSRGYYTEDFWNMHIIGSYAESFCISIC